MKEKLSLPSKYLKLKQLMLHGSCGLGLQLVWCGVVWCGVVWCCGAVCGVVWCGAVRCGVVWCGTGHLQSAAPCCHKPCTS